MRCWFPWILLASATASRTSDTNTRHVSTDADGLEHTVFHYPPTDSKLDYKTDSGVCETTPGVHQHSGYASVGEDMNMFFWLFEARHNPKTAPLVLYMNGGPGGNDEALVFSAGGPCLFKNNDTEPSLNPHSFNEYANMLFIDQPLATGFSYGENPINSTAAAAKYIWKFLQAFLAEFQEYQGRDFGILGISYGGHTGPALAYRILENNLAIEAGTLQGSTVNLTAMGLINAWMDARIQTRKNIEFAYENDYRPLIDRSLFHELMNGFEEELEPVVDRCQRTLSNASCDEATRTEMQLNYNGQILESAMSNYSDFEYNSMYDVRENTDLHELQSKRHRLYMNDTAIQNRINAKHTWRSMGGGTKIRETGDDWFSFMPAIENALERGVKVSLITGDADYVCSWLGTMAVALRLEWQGQDRFLDAHYESYLVNGKSKGTYKAVDNLREVIVWKAGHNVPQDQPEAALQFFQQTFMGNLTST